MTDAPRNWRNSNPLNLRPAAEPYPGQTGVDTAEPDPPYAIFGTGRAGWAQAYRQLLIDYDAGLTTLELLTWGNDQHKGWAPQADHNDPDNYAQIVSRITGIAVDEDMQITLPARMLSISFAMAIMEGGHLPWSQDERVAALGDAEVGT